MDFAEPRFFWLLLLVPCLLIPTLGAGRHAMLLANAFGRQAAVSVRRRTIAGIFAVVLATLSLVTALASPRVLTYLGADPQRDLVVAVGIDVSKSMLAEDVSAPESFSGSAVPINRLDVSAHLAEELFGELTGERAGLFFFAKNGIEVTAPTRDQGFLRYMVRHTNLAELTESGSNLAAALETGRDMIESAESPVGGIVLISDGEDTENRISELRELAATGQRIPVFTVGIGRAEDAYLPIRRPGLPGIQGFYTDSSGDYLQTRLEERSLREIAEATGGGYWRYEETSAEELIRILPGRLAAVNAEHLQKAPRKLQRVELSPLFLVFGLLFYLGYRLL
ncbi:MAG: VWA domain-containing protein [Syntrophotaleaceae bacterium]